MEEFLCEDACVMCDNRFKSSSEMKVLTAEVLVTFQCFVYIQVFKLQLFFVKCRI